MPSDVERLRRDVSLPETAALYGCRLKRNGREYLGCCPFHQDAKPSFTIFMRPDGIERFHCFGCGADGDIMDFVQRIKGVDLAEAIRILDGIAPIGTNTAPRAAMIQDPYEGITPLPPPERPLRAGARLRLYNPKRKGSRTEWGTLTPSMVFPYRSQDGALTGYVLRHDLPDGAKETPMVMFVSLPNGRQTWARFPFPRPRPLYGLESLGHAGQLILVEGEKCRDRLAEATGRTVLSWAGGTHGARHADWQPLAGRDILIWPDFDAPGLAAAQEIAGILTGLDARVRLAGFSNPAQSADNTAAFTFADWQAGSHPARGWDCADAIDAGWTRDELDRFIRATMRPIGPASSPERSAPPPPPPPAGADTAPESSGPPPGADGIEAMPASFPPQPYGSEVWLARIFRDRLAEACGGQIVCADGRFWAYGPSAWRPISDQKIRLAVHAFDAIGIGPKEQPLRLGRRMIDGIVNEFATKISKDGFFANPAIGLNAKNCTITIDASGRVICRDHDPQDRFRFTIDAAYHAPNDTRLAARSLLPEGSLLHRLLHGAFMDDPDAAEKIDLVAEMLGAAAFGLATRIRQPKAFILLGETASNGKSTVASLFRALLPEGSVSSISPAFFNDEKRIINLAGKAANVADELSAAAISGEEFKAAVTGNPIEGRSLYKNVVSFSPRALHCFTTNTLPRFNGGIDRGLRRRLVVIPFNRTIPEGEVIPDIAERIAEEELELLLAFAVSGAQRLKRRGAYSLPESSKEALNHWLLLDPLNEWFDMRMEPATLEPAGGWLRTARLFEDFRKWATDQGYRESFLPPVNTFSQRLKSMPDVRLKRLSFGTVAEGVALKESALAAGHYADVF